MVNLQKIESSLILNTKASKLCSFGGHKHNAIQYNDDWEMYKWISQKSDVFDITIFSKNCVTFKRLLYRNLQISQQKDLMGPERGHF